MKPIVGHGIMVLVLLLLILSITYRYIAPETGFYGWDYADYHNYASLVVDAFRDSPSQGWQWVSQSLTQQKNALHTLPLLPILWLGDNSRLAYILGIALVYLLPFCLGMGAVATELPLPHLQRWGKPVVFWLTTVLTLLLPMTWIPLLRGYPDIGGALFLVLATWLYLRNPRLTYLGQSIALGGCLGLAILMRRHFAYPALSLILAAAASQCPRAAKDWRRGVEMGGRLLLVGLVTVLVMLIVAREFTQTALTTDFSGRYQLWSLPVGVMLRRLGPMYGWGVWGLALLGWWGLLRWGQRRGRFVALAGMLSLALLIFKLRYGNLHYTLHLTPWLILGLLAMLDRLQHLQQRRWLLVVLSAYLGVNLSLGLGSVVPGLSPGGIFARAYPPLVRQDKQELQRLLLRLQELSEEKQQIAVLAASNRLNASMFWSEGFQQFGTSRPLNLLPVAIFDGPVSPLAGVLLADVVMVATPTQVIGLEEEQVVRSRSQTMLCLLSQGFSQGWPIAQDFRRLPEVFELDGGIRVWLYKRHQPTSPEVETETRQQLNTLEYCE